MALAQPAQDPNVIESPYMKFLDLKQSIDYFLIDLYTGNGDGLALSTYFYKTRDGMHLGSRKMIFSLF